MLIRLQLLVSETLLVTWQGPAKASVQSSQRWGLRGSWPTSTASQGTRPQGYCPYGWPWHPRSWPCSSASPCPCGCTSRASCCALLRFPRHGWSGSWCCPSWFTYRLTMTFSAVLFQYSFTYLYIRVYIESSSRCRVYIWVFINIYTIQ